MNFDLLKIGEWLDKAMKTQDVLILPSNFLADLGFSVDIYDGKILIGSINRTRLPERRLPLQIGDELVSLDGVATQDPIQSLSPFPQFPSLPI